MTTRETYVLEAMLRKYLERHWKPNPSGLLFPNAKGTHPRWRDHVVKYGLKPVLKQLGIQAKDRGLHAFRHGLATELAEQAVPLTVLQQQMRHADIRPRCESTLTRSLRRSGT
jgi:integrase